MKLCVGINLKLGIWFWTLKNTEPLGKFKPNLVQTNTFVWRNFKLPQMKDHAFFQGEIITIWRKYIVFFRITRPKASLCEKNESLFRWRAMPFSKGYDYEMAKSHWRNFKVLFSRATRPFSTDLSTKHLWLRRNLFV